MRVVLQKGSSIEKNPPSHSVGLWASLKYIFLIDDLCGRTKITVGGANPGLIVLGAIRKQVEQAMRSKPVSSIPPQPLQQLQPPGSRPDFLQ